MTDSPHYAEAMRRKRLALLWLVAALAAVVLLLWKGRFGGWGIGLGWAALLAGVVAGNRILSCPACGLRLGGLFDKVCARCGAVLTDEPVMPPAKEGQADPRAVEYMERSRLILRRWGGVRRWLGKGIYAVGVLAAAGVAVTMRLHDGRWGEGLVLGLFLGVVAAAAWWLILIYMVDNLFGIGFLLLRCRCPVCRAWFNPPASFGPGSAHIDYSLPDFCVSCGARLKTGPE